MTDTISRLDMFKKFNTVNTNLSANVANNENNSPIAGTQMFIQGSAYNFKENADSYGDNAAKKSGITYVKTPTSKKAEEKLKSKMLPGGPITKLKVQMKKISKLPEYAYRGMKGDPNANFYEYLSLGNIPYFIGGPMLAAVFAFGRVTSNPQAKAAATLRAKQIAVGVAFYYLGAELAKKAIDIPVKLFRGIDLNHPYEHVVSCRAVSKTGHSPKKIEYHKVPESVDFTRFDLMQGDETIENGKIINEKFDKLAGKFGIDKDVQDSDTTLKGSIKKLIISATACKYMLTAPFVVLGVALAAQGRKVNEDSKALIPIWGDLGKNTLKSIKFNLKEIFGKSGYSLKERWNIVKDISKENLLTESFKALWGKKGSPNKVGRAIILTAAIAPILANLRILQLTSEKHNKFVDITEYIPGHKKAEK